jgi:hypothetical protein
MDSIVFPVVVLNILAIGVISTIALGSRSVRGLMKDGYVSRTSPLSEGTGNGRTTTGTTTGTAGTPPRKNAGPEGRGNGGTTTGTSGTPAATAIPPRNNEGPEGKGNGTTTGTPPRENAGNGTTTAEAESNEFVHTVMTRGQEDPILPWKHILWSCIAAYSADFRNDPIFLQILASVDINPATTAPYDTTTLRKLMVCIFDRVRVAIVDGYDDLHKLKPPVLEQATYLKFLDLHQTYFRGMNNIQRAGDDVSKYPEVWSEFMKDFALFDGGLKADLESFNKCIPPAPEFAAKFRAHIEPISELITVDAINTMFTSLPVAPPSGAKV